MKSRYVVIFGAALGAVLGSAISWANFGNSPPLATGNSPVGPVAIAPGKQPKLLVDTRFHDFGPVERDSKVRHAFRFTNAGDADLTLKPGGTTCTKCTIAELTKAEVAPGETVDVIVEYLTSEAQPRFRQTATILTNDPASSRVELNIVGTVTTQFRITPDHLVLSKVSANETKTSYLKVFAYLADEVHLAGHSFTGADTAPYYEVKSEPIAPDMLTEPGAKSGCLISVTVKPGLPLGPIRQTIRLELAMAGIADPAKVDIPVEGTVDSDISIVGQGWRSDFGRLSLGAVKSAEGTTRALFLLVRGDHRHGVTIKPGKVEPPWLQVELGEPSELAGGTVTQIPLTIRIPPGQPPAIYLGTEQGKYAEIVLETTHPQVKQIRMYVQFVIEK